MTPRCRRCSGSLLVERDLDGDRVAKCVLCGRTADYEDVGEMPNLNDWTIGEDEQLLALRAGHATWNGIARELDRSLKDCKDRYTALTQVGGQECGEPQEDAVTQMDWRLAAKGELDALIEAIVKVEDQKAEAERIRAALQQLGVPDLPELPWKGKAGMKRTSRRPWPAEDDAALLRMRAEGRSMSQIASLIGRSDGSCYKRLESLREREAVSA